jgi:hypothetical protein
MLGMWEDGYGNNGMHSILDERCVVWNEGAHEYVLMNKRFVYRL